MQYLNEKFNHIQGSESSAEPNLADSIRFNNVNINLNKNLSKSQNHQPKSILINRNTFEKNKNPNKTKKEVKFDIDEEPVLFKNTPAIEEMLKKNKNMNFAQFNDSNQYQPPNINIDRNTKIQINGEVYTSSKTNEFNQNNANLCRLPGVNSSGSIEKQSNEDVLKQYSSTLFDQLYRLTVQNINENNETSSRESAYIKSINNTAKQNNEPIHQNQNVNVCKNEDKFPIYTARRKSRIKDFSQDLQYQQPNSNKEESNKNLFTEVLFEEVKDNDLDYDKKCLRSKMQMNDHIEFENGQSYKFFQHSKIKDQLPSEQIFFENMESKRSYGIDISGANKGPCMDILNRTGFSYYDNNDTDKYVNKIFPLKVEFKNEDLNKKEPDMKMYKFSIYSDDYLPIVEDTEGNKGLTNSIPEMEEFYKKKLLKELKSSAYESRFPYDDEATRCRIM